MKVFLFVRDHLRYRGKHPSLREIQAKFEFKSPRSAQLLVDSLINSGYLARTDSGALRILKNVQSSPQSEQVIDLPLVGAVPCGMPLLAQENIEVMISVSQRLAKPGAQYFLLKATGDSMNKAGIADGDILLVRQQPVAEDGDRVVALIGDEATVKVLEKRRDKVILRPKSTNTKHKPIIMDEDFMIQGVVINVLPNPMD